VSGRLLKLEELSSPQVADLDRGKTAFFIPISPLEGHGPHLPLGVDFFDALFFAENMARITLEKHPEFDTIIAPGIPLGAQVYRLPGSIRIDSRTTYKIACNIGDSLASWGFRYIFILSGHGSPKHIVALESACLKVSRKYRIEMHSLSGALAVRFLRGEFVERISGLLSKPLSDDEKKLLKSDIHGGWWETSMMLLLRPELVNPVYKDLETIKWNKRSKGPRKGYYGSPSLAQKEFAEVSLKVMTDEACSTIDRIFSSENKRSETISPLHKLVILRPNFGLYATFFTLFIIILALLGVILIDKIL
jgi:creatinine amidohydrolase